MNTTGRWMWAAFAAGALALTGCRDQQQQELGTGGAGTYEQQETTVVPSQTEQDPRYDSIKSGSASGLEGNRTGGAATQEGRTHGHGGSMNDTGMQQGQTGTGGAGIQQGQTGSTGDTGMQQGQTGTTGETDLGGTGGAGTAGDSAAGTDDGTSFDAQDGVDGTTDDRGGVGGY